MVIELEKTYLLKYIPEGLKDAPFKEIIDLYIPQHGEHQKLRLRQAGKHYEITRKEPCEGDCSEQTEDTIILNEAEFNALKTVPAKKVHKIRYYYSYGDKIAEIDIFKGPMRGLVLVDFEFQTRKEKDDFRMPDFCLKDVTQEIVIAGGVLSNSTYEKLEPWLAKQGYKKLLFN